MLVAHMEETQHYADDDLYDIYGLLRPAPEMALTLQDMPDMAVDAARVEIWSDRCFSYWSALLTRALPNPCKGRALIDTLLADMAANENVFDMALRIVFGSLLGLYNASVVPAFRERVALYAVFALHPPTPQQLGAFMVRHKKTTEFCFRAYLLFMMQQTALHGYLCDKYRWAEATAYVWTGMDELRAALPSIITSPDFLFRSDDAWRQIETRLKVLNRDAKAMCFRPAKVPFYLHVLAEIQTQRRAHDTGDDGIPVSAAAMRPLPRHLDHVLRFPSQATPAQLQIRMTLLDGVVDLATQAALKRAEAAYAKEQQMTLARRLLAGTEKRRTGIFQSHRQQMECLFSFYTACHMRLRVNWSYLPLEWAERQLQSLRKTHGFLHPETGCYYFCPRCGEIKSTPVTWPNGANERLRGAALMMQRVRNDLRYGRHLCASMGLRRKEAIKRRRARPPDAAKRGNAAHLRGDDIYVCGSTPLMTVCMVGIALVFVNRYILVLCVHCGTLVKWSPECISVDGPTCGCQNAPDPDAVETFVCAICNAETSSVRVHTVIHEGQTCLVRVCRTHGTEKWADSERETFTLETLRRAVDENQRVRSISETTYFFAERKKSKIG